MNLTGTIKKISDLQTFTSGFQKKELVLLTEEQYPQPILIEFLSEKTDLLNGCSVGDKINVFINMRGREWTSPQGEVKYFNSITGWKIEKLESSEQSEQPKENKTFTDDEDDDLPF